MEGGDSDPNDQLLEPKAAENSNKSPDPQTEAKTVHINQSYTQFQGMVTMFANAIHFGVGDNQAPKTTQNISSAVAGEKAENTLDEPEQILSRIENIKSCLRSGHIKEAIKQSKEVVASIEAVIVQEDTDYIKPLYYKELDDLIKLFTEIEHIESVYQLMKCRLTLIQNYFDDSKLNGELVAFTEELIVLALVLCSKNPKNKQKFHQFYPVLEEILEFAEKLEIPNSNIKEGLRSTLLFKYGRLCFHCDDYQKSLQLLQQVISRTVNSKELGGDENRFTSLCFAGLSLLYLQRFSEAKPYIEESLSLREIVLKNKNLREGVVEEIKEKCQKALKIIEKESAKDEDKQ